MLNRGYKDHPYNTNNKQSKKVALSFDPVLAERVYVSAESNKRDGFLLKVQTLSLLL